MTTFTFTGSSSDQNVDWTDPTVWSGNAVPDSPGADVVIPTIFFTNTAFVYKSDITLSGTIGVGELSVSGNFLGIAGALSVGGDFDIQNTGQVNVGGSLTVGGTFEVDQGGEVGLSNSTLIAASIQNNGLFYGDHVSVVATGEIVNGASGVIEGYINKPITLTAPGFDNVGELYAFQGPLIVNVTAGGFTNLTGGTLTGGTYLAENSLELNVGGVITTDAASITLSDNGELSFYNNALAAYQPIESTLKTIAPGGVLTLTDSRAAVWGTALTDDGTLVVNNDASLTTPALIIGANGTLLVDDTTIGGPVTDDGLVVGAPLATEGPPQTVTFTGAVAGSGTVEENAITFGAAASVNVALLNIYQFGGTLVLDDTAAFTGSIGFTGYAAPTINDKIYLQDVLLGDVTGYSYAGNGLHGTLTIDRSGGAPPITLNFTGDFDTDSFRLIDGQTLSSKPATVLITVTHAPPRDDFLGAGLSDVLLQNASGQVDVGQLHNFSMGLADISSSLGAQWKFEGNGDFLGNGVDQFLIENTGGSVGLGSIVGGQLDLTPIATLDPSWRFVESGHFLGDGAAQFLIENSAGQVDLGQVAGGKASETQLDTLGSQWKFVGAGDYLGLGDDQAAIENTAGSVGVGTATGSSITFKTVGTLTPTQHIVETGDFLGDGKSDFLIDNSATGAVDVGEVVNGHLTLTQVDTLGSQWSFVGAGDYLGDGNNEVMIENTTGDLGLGIMIGGPGTQHLHFTTVATGFSEWTFH